MVMGMAHKHMNLRSTKKRKRIFRFRIFIYFMIIYISFCYTFYFSLKNSKRVSNEEFINLMLASSNANVLNEYRVPNLVNSTMKFFLNVDFTKPVTILNSNILKYGSMNSDVKKVLIEFNDDYSNMDELKDVSDYIKDPSPKDIDNPIVYIYNSHQLENYNNDKLEVYGITPNVMMASYVFREKLLEEGVKSIVEEGNMSDILKQNGWDYSYSYQASRSFIMEKKNKYSSLKYFVDIHRDSVSREATVVNINNVNYAKVLFVVGMDYKGWEDNFNNVSKLNKIIEDSYPGLSRGIMKKTGANVNGVYNQDISSNCMLIEVGGVDNNIDEVYQTIGALSKVFSKYIKG